MTQRSSETQAGEREQPYASGAWRLALWALALALGLFGLAMFGGGIWLVILGGSWYYALAGAGSLVTALLLCAKRRSALHLFAVIWSLTVVWALWEVGLNWWGLVPRLVAMTVILILILLLSPALRRVSHRAA